MQNYRRLHKADYYFHSLLLHKARIAVAYRLADVIVRNFCINYFVRFTN